MTAELNDRIFQVQRCLSQVCDPELDEAVTDLGFIDDISVNSAGDVKVRFHLPTFWCGANFAFLMASDIREAVSELSWINHVQIELEEHFCAKEINSGVEDQRAFKELFPDEADDDLDSLRLLFSRKSFQRRQELLLRNQLPHCSGAESLIGLSLHDLCQLELDEEASQLRERYMSARQKLGFTQDGSTLAFHDVDGAPLDIANFESYLRQLRTVRINTELNGVLCRGLLEARYGIKQQDELVVIK
jgi:metal-sulfur cluster biosynthetic enzyme